MFLIKLTLPLLLLSACTTPAVVPPVQPLQSVPVSLQQHTVADRAIVRSDFRYSADQTELTIIMEHDNGETQENILTRRPLGNTVVNVETVIKRNGSVQRRHRTRADEAKLAVKVAANNGWRNVYNDLKERYQLAGLL